MMAIYRFFLILLLVILALTGCVKSSTEIIKDEKNGRFLEYDYEKFPYSAGIFMSDSFKEFELIDKAQQDHLKDEFVFLLGKDFNQILPAYFKNRYKKLEILTSKKHFDSYDYVFDPNIALSELQVKNDGNTNIISCTLNVKLKIKVYKKDTFFDTIRANEVFNIKIEHDVLGENKKIPERKEISLAYDSLLNKLFSSLDTYLLSIMNSDCM